MQVVICDIDGTLADIRHRLHHVLPGEKRDWGAFFAEMHRDEIIAPVREIVAALEKSYRVVLCSGRPETYRAATEAWLGRHCVPYLRLYMRPAEDLRPDHEVKAEMLATIRGDGLEPIAVIDDRQSVVDMWRSCGLLCLQVAAAEEEIPAGVTLTIMVGPSGGGKSTWLKGPDAKALGIRPSHIIASDDVRADLCGDFRDQSRNQDVFAAVHALARTRLRSGLPTVIDATNLRRKDRLACVALVPMANPVRYIVIDRPEDAKRRDGGWRNVLEIDLIGKHAQIFGSQLKDIMAGDNLPNVKVYDLRT